MEIIKIPKRSEAHKDLYSVSIQIGNEIYQSFAPNKSSAIIRLVRDLEKQMNKIKLAKEKIEDTYFEKEEK